MILLTHQMLAQEPWCFHPQQIANLTDWQIEHLYAKPAIERAKQIESRQKDLPGIVGDQQRYEGLETLTDGGERGRKKDIAVCPVLPPEPGSSEFRGWVIAQFMAMGMSRAEAEKKYDEQAKNPPME